MYSDEPDCELPDDKCSFESLEKSTDVKVPENYLVTISEPIVIDAVRKVTQMLWYDTFRADYVRNHK